MRCLSTMKRIGTFVVGIVPPPPWLLLTRPWPSSVNRKTHLNSMGWMTARPALARDRGKPHRDAFDVVGRCGSGCVQRGARSARCPARQRRRAQGIHPQGELGAGLPPLQLVIGVVGEHVPSLCLVRQVRKRNARSAIRDHTQHVRDLCAQEEIVGCPRAGNAGTARCAGRATQRLASLPPGSVGGV